jgi:glycogen debranching enzyme
MTRAARAPDAADAERDASAAGAAGGVRLDAPPKARDIRDAIVIKEGDLFLLTDLEGNVPLGNLEGYGLYYQDTRYLSGYELVIENLPPTILLSTGRAHFLGAQVLTNPNIVLSDGTNIVEQTIQIRRYRVVRSFEVTESLTLQNFNAFPVRLEVGLRFEADFADMFEIRGIVERDPDGDALCSARSGGAHGDVLTFSRDGRDDTRRSTTIRFDPKPTELARGTASYAVELPARASRRLALTVSLNETLKDAPDAPDPSRTARSAHAGYRRWLNERVSLVTDNHLFNAVMLQSRFDLRLLLSGDGDLPFVAAGIPWYATLFGRDALITALQTLWESPVLSKQTLRLLARYQGRRDDPDRDEEPGKIMHELRRGEVARIGLAPFAPYYGSVDATPLWVHLLGDYYTVTADLELVRELQSNLDAALLWMDRYGDLDGDGFIEYHCRAPRGLPNQGWKDSTEAIVHSDGSRADSPIALVEVQAYAYAARRGAARLYRALGEPEQAMKQELLVAHLRGAFNDAFWMEDEGFYALALDRHKRQVRAITSNPGHALFAGIVPEDRAERVARRLMAEDMFTGFGIRTLANHETAFNPTGYHVGTVWPHDNAFAALGLKRYGFEGLALDLVGGLLDAAQHFPSHRMPELMCGFDRSAFGAPVRYPVACSPQAWAATTWSALARVMLGLQADGVARELRIVRPRLPDWLTWVDVARVPVGDGEVDLRYERSGQHTAVDVVAMRGNVRVVFAPEWCHPC